MTDRVTGHQYEIRVETDEASEVLTLFANEGAVATGSLFAVTVNSIGDPMPLDAFGER